MAFGFGAALYLALPKEPALWFVALAAGLTIAVAFGARRWSASAVVTALAILMAFGAAGVLAGKVRTERVKAPIAPAGTEARLVEGWVVDVATPGAGGGRLLIAPTSIAGLSPWETPKRIRITVGPDAMAGPGSAIRLRAIVGPPPPPASPGAYDFARDAFFDGVGGVGFTLSDPASIELAPPPWRLRAAMAVNAMRWSLARRIVSRMGLEAGGIAAAMVSGHEAWITPEQTADMRASGLAHILSISGLHMAIVGGFTFAFARLLIAAVPWLALRINGKKAAALVGLAAVAVYLVVSGAPPPAERAAITAATAFGAILADRRAISLHALAVAALAILVLHPEAATEPGFQMSFAATTALVALAEAWPRPVREISVPWPIRLAQGIGVWLAASVGASFVAGLATGPFAMQHFNRVATFGLAANLAVAPLSSFVIMPFLALGAALEPLGLGGPFLSVAGWGIEAMMAIAALVSRRPDAMVTVASAPAFTLPLAFLGLLIVCLWKGRLRWIGLPLAFAVWLWPRPEAPALWIAPDGSTAAVREGGRSILLRPDSRRFAVDLGSRRRGLEIDETGEAYACERQWCLPKGSEPLALWWGRKTPSAAQLEALCERAQVIAIRARVSAVPPVCEGRLLLDGGDFARGGAAELYRTADGWRIVWASDLRGARPWVSGSGG